MAGITIRGLSKSFDARDGEVAAVDDVDLDIKDNSFVTLLGPSGCGKTTTLRLIAGYIVPDRGTIEVDGRLLSSPKAWCRRKRAAWAWCSRTTRSGRTRPCSRTSSSASSCARFRASRGAQEGRGHARAGQPRRPREPLSERALRRPAAARRARPLARGRARHPAARRAALQSRRQAARAHAHRAQGAAAPHRHHLRLRHPRPGRGARAVRPDRGDECRAACSNTARRSRSTRIRRTAWWRTSWAS